MGRKVFVGAIWVAFSTSIPVQASLDTIGPNGINSAGLMGLGGMPLTGAGIGIGQVEIGRPGRRVADGGPDDAAHSDVSIVPAGVFLGNVADTVPNTHTDPHAQWVYCARPPVRHFLATTQLITVSWFMKICDSAKCIIQPRAEYSWRDDFN